MARQVGDTARWTWSGTTTHGTIKQIYTQRVSKTIKGSTIVRNASEDEPAYLIEQDDGDRVLKLDSELE